MKNASTATNVKNSAIDIKSSPRTGHQAMAAWGARRTPLHLPSTHASASGSRRATS
jgi:hypothetical protein